MNKRLFLRHILLLAVLCALVLLGCPLYRFAGFTCPCCGVTRAWLCFLTGGLCGILTIIDWFSVQKKAKELNYNKLMMIL